MPTCYNCDQPGTTLILGLLDDAALLACDTCATAATQDAEVIGVLRRDHATRQPPGELHDMLMHSWIIQYEYASNLMHTSTYDVIKECLARRQREYDMMQDVLIKIMRHQFTNHPSTMAEDVLRAMAQQ